MKQNFDNTISSFEAKTHFSSLIRRVEQGERITILKHNTPVAMIVPIPSLNKLTTKEIIEELKDFSKDKKLDGLTIRELISESRK